MSQSARMILESIYVAAGLVAMAAAVGKFSRPAPFRAALRAQGRGPRSVHFLATWLPPVEALVGLSAVLSGVGAVPASLELPEAFPPAGLGSLGFSFCAYLLWLRPRRPNVPCGCFGIPGQSVAHSFLAPVLLVVGAACGAMVGARVQGLSLTPLVAASLIAALTFAGPLIFGAVRREDRGASLADPGDLRPTSTKVPRASH